MAAVAMAAIALACLAGCAGTGGGQGSAQLRQESYPLLIQGYVADDAPGGEGTSSQGGAPSGDDGPDLTQINLYFGGDGDVPYVAVSEFMPLFGALYESEGSGIPAAEYDIVQEETVTTVTRADNGAVLKVDAGKDVLCFSDFDLFMQSPGTCAVQPCTAASGAMFQISGPCQLSTIRNGSFYDIDKSIAPDFGIDKVETFYDREQLVEFIHGLR